MSSSTILELPPDVQLPESAAAELNMRLLWIGRQLQILSTEASSNGSATTNGLTAIGTRNERLNIVANDANNLKAAQFVETDTGLVYVSRPLAAGSAGYVWKYLSGTARAVWASPLKSLAIFVQTLDTRDEGLLLYVTDKNRVMRWTGTAWTFAPTEVIPIGFIAGFNANPGAGWHILDGSAGVVQLNADGSTTNIALDDFTSAGNKAAYPKWGAAADGFQAAIAPGLSGSTASGAAAIQNGNANIQFASANIQFASANIGNDSGGGTAVQSGAGTTVAPHTHNHTDSGHDHTDSGHVHADSGHAHIDSGHTHGKGTLAVDATAEPRHYDLVPYQRI